MPVSIKAEQDRFTWKLQDDMPVAPVFRIGDGYWYQCPLCSCIHDPLSRTTGEITPRCLVREWNTATYQAWIARYPDAPKHRTVQLVARTVFEAMPYTTPCEGAAKLCTGGNLRLPSVASGDPPCASVEPKARPPKHDAPPIAATKPKKPPRQRRKAA